MAFTLKLRKIGTSVGIVLPKEILARLSLGLGDSIRLEETPDGGLRLLPVDAGRTAVTGQLDAARDIVRRYRNALLELTA